VAKLSKEDEPFHGEAELAELDEIGETLIKNINEIVTIGKHNISRRQVYKYASVLSNNYLISNLLGIDKNTLAAQFKEELTVGRAVAKQKLLTRFYHLALYGNNAADRIFALKNHCGMSDNGLTEELDDIEEGIQFRVARPTKQVIKESRDATQRGHYDADEEFPSKSSFAKVTSTNDTDADTEEEFQDE